MSFHATSIEFRDYAHWQELHRQGIGGSDVAALVGLSPWGSPFTVWVEKMGAVADEPNEAMLLGRRLEPAILEEYAERSGRAVVGQTVLWQHPEYPWARCTSDGLNAFQHHPDCDLLEAKASAEWTWERIPLHYQAQGQWALLVTGLKRCVFAVLHQGRRFATYELAADREDQEVLFDAAKAFWHDHVLNEKAPPVDSFANPILADVWPRHSDSSIEVAGELVGRLRKVRNQIARLKKERDQVEAEVKAALGENAFGTVEGFNRVSWKTQPNNRIDIEALRSAEPEIAEKFTVESTTRVLRLHGKDDQWAS